MDSLTLIQGYLQTALVFLVMITVLVFVHELGHYWFAKLFGMKVDSFAVMVGGVRTTNLESQTGVKLFPAKWVALGYAASAALVLVSGIEGWSGVHRASLVLFGVGFPIWISLRIGNIYGMKPAMALKGLGIGYAVATAFLLFITRSGGFTLDKWLVFLVCASFISLLLLYYTPMLQKAEDAPMGEGELEIEGRSVPVSFRPLFSRKNKEGTEFSFLALPLGGFAAIKGMHPKPDGSEQHVEGGFYSKPPLPRFLVLLAGPLFSVLFGIVILANVFVFIGEQRADNSPVLGAVGLERPAYKAGLRTGDKVLTVDGQPIGSFYEFVSIVRDGPERDLKVTVQREGEQKEFTVRSERDKEPTPVLGNDLEPTDKLQIQNKIGASPSRKFVRLSVGAALARAAVVPFEMVKGLAGVVLKPSRAKDELGGPASIAAITHNATEQGISSILTLAAMLSISLGVMNLLPVPPLDGGQMVVAFVEMLRRGRRLSIEVQRAVSTVGAFLVVLLIVGVLLLDASRFVGR